MKTKVVQHVPRINLSYFKFQIFNFFQIFKFVQIFSGSRLLSDFQTFFHSRMHFRRVKLWTVASSIFVSRRIGTSKRLARWRKCCSQGESQTEQWRHNLYQVRSSLTYVSIDSNLCNIWQGVRSGLHLLAMRDKSINIWQGVRSGFILAAMRFRKSFISAFFG